MNERGSDRGERSAPEEIGSLATNSVFVSVSMFISAVTLLIVNVVLSNSLGTHGIGLVALSTRYVSIIGVLTMVGIPPIVTQMVAAFRSSMHRGRILSTAVCIVMLLSLACLGVLVLTSDLLASLISTPQISPLLIIQSAGLPFAAVSVTVAAHLRGLGRFRDYAILQSLGPFLNLSVVVLFVVSGLIDPALALMAGVIGAILSSFLALSMVRTNQRGAPKTSVAKSMLSLSLPLLVVALVGTIIDSIDILVLRYVNISVGNVGAYSNAYALAVYLRYLVEPIAIVLMPMASGLFAVGNTGTTQRLLSAAVRYVAVVFIPLAICFAVVSRSILLILYPLEFAVADSSLAILSVGSIGLVLYLLASRLLIARRETLVLGATIVLALMLDTVLTFSLSSLFGLVGAATSSSVTFVAMGLLTSAAMRNRTGLRMGFRRKDFSLWAAVLGVDSCVSWILSQIGLELYRWGPIMEVTLILGLTIVVIFIFKPISHRDSHVLNEILDSFPIPARFKPGIRFALSRIAKD